MVGMKVKAAQVATAAEEKMPGAPEGGEGMEKLATWNSAAPPGGGRGVEKGDTVVVGMRMDGEGRELLTWALVKVAEPGDRVVAVHVLPSSPSAAHRKDSDANLTSCSSLISLIRSFDAVLAAYEGFCNLKQIDLKLKICRGSSLRKLLVSEVNNFAATKLVLGVTKNGRAIGSSASVAKYCAKKLPRECSVLAVNNGKILFQKEAPPPSTLCLQATEPQKARDCSHDTAELQGHQTSSKNTEVTNGGVAHSEPLVTPIGEAAKNDSSLGLLCDATYAPNICRGADGGGLPLVSSKSNHSACGSVPESAQVDKRSQGIQPKKDSSMALVRARPSSLSRFAKDLAEPKPGWPLLRRAFLHDKRNASEKRKTSVVQWAMKLPARCSASAAVHPHCKPSKVVTNPPPSLDSHTGAIVPLGSDASHPPDVVHYEEQRKSPKELEFLQLKYSSTCRLFSYNELMNATANFSADKLVGKGGSSRVYKGCLPCGKEIAVKILQQSEDVLKEFVLEVEIITTLHHKNIISLFGFCFENDNFILVYDFLSRGSLEDNLHGDVKGKPSFGWAERYKVAMGVAEALDYLHGAGIAQPVIHRDVKSSNILLTDDYEPQLSDFGLAKWASSTSSNITCDDVAGTFGYLAPEYFMYGKVNEKIDVYAFGVVLLELLTGRKPINTESPKGQESLVMWAKPILESGKVTQLLDPSLGDDYDNDQVGRIILAASLCIKRSPRSRPMMALVLKLLQGDEDIIKWGKLQINGAEEFDGMEDESANPAATLQSHLSLALLDVEDDSLSEGSTDHTADYIVSHGSLEDYLKGRWSRSSSFD